MGLPARLESDGREYCSIASPTKSVAERTLDSLASILVPVPEESNGEVIVAVDAVTGKTCFQLRAPNGKLFGSEGQMNSDISPDGRLVAVAALDRIRSTAFQKHGRQVIRED